MQFNFIKFIIARQSLAVKCQILTMK